MSHSCKVTIQLAWWFLTRRFLKFQPMRTHYGHCQPCWISTQHQKHKSGRGPHNKHFWKVWFKSVQWFQRRFKCEKLTDDDGRTDDGHLAMTKAHKARKVWKVVQEIEFEHNTRRGNSWTIVTRLVNCRIIFLTVFPNICACSFGTPHPLQYLSCHNEMIIMVSQKLLHWWCSIIWCIPTQLFGGDAVAVIVW